MVAGIIPFPNISPEVFSLEIAGASIDMKWYGLSYVAGVFLGGWIASRALKMPSLWRGGIPPMSSEQLSSFMLWIGIGILIGGRIGSILFYQPGYYLHDPLSAFAVWQGGMSFHGGLLGVIGASLVFCRKHRVPILPAADLLALSAPVGLFLGRLANFVNGELWGRPTKLPWAVAFPGDAAQACGQPIGEICARHPSQLYEAVLEGVVLGLIVLLGAYRRGYLRRPGRLTGVFLAGYGLIRFGIEFLRQPDVQFVSENNPIGLAWRIGDFGLTMGQTLCLPMILVGIALVFRSAGQHGRKAGENYAGAHP